MAVRKSNVWPICTPYVVGPVVCIPVLHDCRLSAVCLGHALDNPHGGRGEDACWRFAVAIRLGVITAAVACEIEGKRGHLFTPSALRAPAQPLRLGEDVP